MDNAFCLGASKLKSISQFVTCALHSEYFVLSYLRNWVLSACLICDEGHKFVSQI